MTDRRLASAALVMLFLLVACAKPSPDPSPFETLPEGTPRPPGPSAEPVSGPSFLILPDSELVFSPALADFSMEAALPPHSALRAWSEPQVMADIEQTQTGTELLEKVAREYSVSPRLLLALLEYRAGAISAPQATIPLGWVFLDEEAANAGLYHQLSWAANQLNLGYYAHRVGGLQRITLADGTRVNISPQVNAGTAAVQYLLGLMLGYHEWQAAVSPLGVYAAYLSLFGDPHGRAIDPLLPPDLAQSEMRLPFDPQEGVWYFTGGPHSAWGSGAAWGALDFAPDEGALGCYDSRAWVLAVADGPVVHSAQGAVVQNLDGHATEADGWTVLYLHVAEFERIPQGAYLRAGERVGHPSCEGGPSSGTHLHIARRYNGEWIPADQELPFVLSGWVSGGDGVEYNGWLAQGGRVITALGYPADENKITP